MRLLRRILCAIGWHCGEVISTGPLGKFRCVCCGIEDYETDYVVLWSHK